ncbi:MAG TPA: LCP family protein [Aggregatilineales bacterium]|nr:LCP family protein [Aggregatilineales bacterium]
MIRILRVVVLRVIPVILMLALGLAILYYGAQVISAIGRVDGERGLIEGRDDAYRQTATAINVTHDEARFPLEMQIVYVGDVNIAQFATNTPQPAGDAFATSTPAAPQDTAPTATPQPVQFDATPGPLPTILFLGEPSADERAKAPTEIPPAIEVVPRNHNLVNILLMGQDNELTGESIARTDTMIVVSINRDTNTVSMLSLPRDLYIYMPLAGMNRLNVTYGVGENLGWNGGAFFYMRQVLLYNLGINVHYFAMVDLSGFATLIDRIGGIDLAVDCAIQDYPLIGAEVPAAAIKAEDSNLYTLPVGYYHLSGAEALWYARSRENSDDFDRGRRQQQILRAAFRQALASGVLNDVLQLPGLINEGLQVVDTDLSANDILSLVPVALSVNPDQIENFRLIRTYHTQPWQPPDGAFVQLPVRETLFDLMVDFYTPPTANQLSLTDASIRVKNGTANDQWDRLVAERLGWSNIGAVPAGAADRTDYGSTVVIDYTGSDKGSILPLVLRAVNVRPENVIIQPDANREVDFEVIVGADYSSCTGAVLPPQ